VFDTGYTKGGGRKKEIVCGFKLYYSKLLVLC
jgi:hypothetical protein